MATLKTLDIDVNNISEAVQVNGYGAVVRVTTTEASVITLMTSVDGGDFFDVADVSFPVDGTKEIILRDTVPGQFIKVKSSGAMSVCKILAE